MSRIQVMAAAALAALFAVSTAWGQQQTQRVAGVIDKVEGKTLYIKSAQTSRQVTMSPPAASRSPTALRRQWSCASFPTACAAMATDIGRGGRAPLTAP